MPTRRTGPRRAPATARMIALLIALVVLASVGALGGGGSPELAAALRRVGIGLPFLPAPAPSPVAVAPLADGTIAVYFTSPELVYPDLPRDRVPPAPEQALIADIEAATDTIAFVSFEYNLGSVAEALARARARGVAVRLALDREVLEHPAAARWAGVVEAAGIAVRWEESDAFLHSKFVVIDERLVWTGSWNATVNDTYRNNNNLLRITARPIIANYLAEFERMAAGDFGTTKGGRTPHPLVRRDGVSVATYFSPHEPVRPHVIDRIAGARASVDVLAFSLTDDEVGEALVARHRAGVRVRAVFERRNAEGVGSEYGRLRASGLAALEDGNCYTMHHKVIIIDRQVVITGSYNFTARAEDTNDENLLIIDSPAIAAAYLAEFERVYRQAELPTRCE